MEKPLKARMHILSPVHIGCDDVYEPTNFVIDEKNGKLIEFDPMDFIKSLSQQDREQFTAICMQGTISSIISIYRFISLKQSQSRINGREIEIAADLRAHYKRVRDLPLQDERRIRQELNQFAISRTVYNPHGDMPYIPGSSLKGALRTAYLSKLAKEAGVKDWWKTSQARENNRARELELHLLNGSFDTDPFRMIKVSDFIPVSTHEVKTKVVYAVNRKKRKSKFEARGPFQVVETIKDGAVFEGMINIQQPEPSANIERPIKVEELLRSINEFYVPLVNEENKVASEIDAGQVIVKRINERFKGQLGKTSYLIRLGRHSGAEAVTIEGNRYIKIMQGKGKPPKFLNQATTLWMASETSKPTANNALIPFGWAVLEVL